jgi:3-(3-hydroxy-phenyl)propionate hydroxylase
VTAGRAGPALLDGYDAERRGHATAMVSFATRVGSMYQPRNRATEIVRDGFFRAVQRIPGARDYILQMKYKPAPRYTAGAVVAAERPDPGSPVGRQFGQPFVEDADGARRLLDDVLGPVVAVIGLTRDPTRHLSPEARVRLERAGGRTFEVRPSRPGARSGLADPGSGSIGLVDVDGAFRDLLLARPQDEVLVVRPDRYVAAACRADALEGVLDRLHERLDTPR